MATNQALKHPRLRIVRRPAPPPLPAPPAKIGTGRAPVLRHLPSGRTVLDTGAVLIGSRYEPPNHSTRQVSADAVRVQAALTAKHKPPSVDGYVGWFCLLLIVALLIAIVTGKLG